MSFTEFMVLKFIVVVVLAGIYGFWKGITGRK
jgi:hypothetical protein